MADFKSVSGSKFEAARLEMIRVFKRYGDDLTPVEQLAVAAYFVGQLIAMQDATKMNGELCFELVMANIERGNQEAVANILGTAMGKPN